MKAFIVLHMVWHTSVFKHDSAFSVVRLCAMIRISLNETAERLVVMIR